MKAEAHCAVCRLMPDSSQHWTMAHSMATPSSAGWTVLPSIRPHGNGPIPRQPGPGCSMTAGSHPADQHCLGRSSPGRCFKPICAGKVPRPPKSEDRGAQQTRGTPPPGQRQRGTSPHATGKRGGNGLMQGFSFIYSLRKAVGKSNEKNPDSESCGSAGHPALPGICRARWK